MDYENTSVDVVDSVPSDGGASVAPVADSQIDTPTQNDAPPVQVVSVEELVERLTAGAVEESETIPAGETLDGEDAEPTLQEQYFMSALEDTSNADTVQLLTEIKQEVMRHPALTTDFADYTVSEGLLLLLFLSVFGSWLVKILKGGFSWLF